MKGICIYESHELLSAIASHCDVSVDEQFMHRHLLLKHPQVYLTIFLLHALLHWDSVFHFQNGCGFEGKVALINKFSDRSQNLNILC